MTDFPFAGRISFDRSESRALPDMPPVATTTFSIGDVVRHRMFDFRGVVFDIDPVFANSDEWYDAIPEGIRPAKDQPFYHLLAESADESYVAYVSQQNLLRDADGGRSITRASDHCSISAAAATMRSRRGCATRPELRL